MKAFHFLLLTIARIVLFLHTTFVRHPRHSAEPERHLNAVIFSECLCSTCIVFAVKPIYVVIVSICPRARYEEERETKFLYALP